MIYACYFVPREGFHPHATLADYSKMWPIMHRSLRRLGHTLVHITNRDTPCWGDSVYRVSVDPDTTIYSRDVAWLSFLKSLRDYEEACMIEPDTVVLKDVPPIEAGKDMVMLTRASKTIPGWFKLGTRRSAPFQQQVVREYDSLPQHLRSLHGDIFAMHRALGIPDGAKAIALPSEAHGVKIEHRDWIRYGYRKAQGSDPILLQYKGISKHEMLRTP